MAFHLTTDRYISSIAYMICTPNFTQRVCYYQSAYRVCYNISRQSRVIRQFSQASRDSNGTTVIPPYLIVGCCVPVIGIGCAYYACLDTVPYTNRRRILATNPKWEAEMGHEQYKLLLDQYKGNVLPNEHRASVTVRRVGGRIAIAVEKCLREWTTTTPNYSTVQKENVSSNPPYTYTVIRSSDANAFVLPGNHVFVLTGLFKHVRDEDELASIMGHEMAHNLARHAGERLSDTILLSILHRLSLFIDPSGTLLTFLIPAGTLLRTLPHSREHEMEADRIGLILASEACYDPHAAVRVFARMKEDEENYNNNNKHQGDNHRRKTSPPEWMSTHPGYNTRLSLFDKWMPDALDRFNIGDGSKCQSIREEMKRARVLAAAMHDGNEGKRRFQ